MKKLGWMLVVGFCLCALLSTRAAQESQESLGPNLFSILRGGNARALRAALDGGASPNARDAAGNTPLLLAAAYGDAPSLQLLLERGADVNATNRAGATALMRAATSHAKLRMLLERGASANARSALGNTALLLAARPSGSYAAVKLLVAHGADVTATNNAGGSALMAAAAGGDLKTARLLIERGANVNAQPTPDEPGFLFGGGRTPLMWAAFRGNVPMVELLIEAGANVNDMTGLGTALSQATWADRTDAARLLIERGANVNQAGPRDGFAPLHWAASTEQRSPALVKLLLEHHADANLDGGDPVDAFMNVSQTPLMLARRRGNSALLDVLRNAGATNATPAHTPVKTPPARSLPETLDLQTTRGAIALAVPPLQQTSIRSKQNFLKHESRQDCTSCHQQHLPMAAIAMARQQSVAVDREAERQLIAMVREGAIKDPETDWQALFHPDAVFTKGYELFAFAAQDLPGDATTDAWVNHVAAIQGRDGQWHNNLPRPPIQTGDIGATAMGIHALQRYPLPGRKAEFAKQVERARRWLWNAQPENTEGRIWQILGLAWAGESQRKLRPLAAGLLAEQRSDGGWAQLPGLNSDAYATGQALYALRIGAGLESSHANIDRGVRFLLRTQLADGTWHVRRRAFPFQPTMNSGFPHGRDSWISAAASSWAVMALSLPEETRVAGLRR